MGLLKSARRVLKKGEATLVLQAAIMPYDRQGMLGEDSELFAAGLVESVWQSRPEVFDGLNGGRPHKILVAIAALARGLDYCDPHSVQRNAVLLSLGHLINHVNTAGIDRPLNRVDRQLLAESIERFLHSADGLGDLGDGIIDTLS